MKIRDIIQTASCNKFVDNFWVFTTEDKVYRVGINPARFYHVAWAGWWLTPSWYVEEVPADEAVVIRRSNKELCSNAYEPEIKGNDVVELLASKIPAVLSHPGYSQGKSLATRAKPVWKDEKTL